LGYVQIGRTPVAFDIITKIEDLDFEKCYKLLWVFKYGEEERNTNPSSKCIVTAKERSPSL